VEIEPAQQERARRGFLNAHRVRVCSFWITTISIAIAVTASILAIWQFTGTYILLRTVATCAVVVAGTLAFSVTNGLFADS
jgi:hypothetical protein